MKQRPDISVIMPVRNEAKKIRACIEGLLNQTIPVLEIIVIDSGSTDDTLNILREYPIVRLIEITPQSFNHGLTRNIGVREAKGDYLLFTVGDAIPADDKLIQHLVSSLQDEKVVAACGQQIVPHSRDCNPVEWFRPQSMPSEKLVCLKPGEFDHLNPIDKKQITGWDNVIAMYKAEILRKIPFEKVTYGEDKLWIFATLRSGKCVSYNTAARVYHYHDESSDYLFKKTVTMHAFNLEHLNYLPQMYRGSIRRKLSVVKTITCSKGLKLSERLKWWNYNHKAAKAIRLATRSFLTFYERGEKELNDWCLKYTSTAPRKKEQIEA